MKNEASKGAGVRENEGKSCGCRPYCPCPAHSVDPRIHSLEQTLNDISSKLAIARAALELVVKHSTQGRLVKEAREGLEKSK